jgi:hypothetical protein
LQTIGRKGGLGPVAWAGDVTAVASLVMSAPLALAGA